MRRTTAISLLVLALLALSVWSRAASRIVAAVTALFILFLCIHQIVSAMRGGHSPSYQGIPERLRKFLMDEDETQLRFPSFKGKVHRPTKTSP